MKQRPKNIINTLMSIVDKGLSLLITSVVLIVVKWKQQNITLALNSLIERKQMCFQSSLEAIRFLLMSECKWQIIPCSGTMIGKRMLTIGL